LQTFLILSIMNIILIKSEERFRDEMD